MSFRDTTKSFRGETFPKFVNDETSERKRYPQRLTVSEGPVGANLHYRRSRWGRLDFERMGMSTREIFCWLEIDGHRVGAIQLREYRADDYLDNDDFFEFMDSFTQSASDLASTVMVHWEEVVDFFDYGSLLEFHAVWTDPRRCPTGLWSLAANDLISRECPNYSVLVLKAFPLEYENNENELLTASRKRRQQAMRRHYSRLLSATPFPKDREWMYRINPTFLDVVDEPQSSEPTDA